MVNHTIDQEPELLASFAEVTSSFISKSPKPPTVLVFFEKLGGAISKLRGSISGWRESVFRGREEPSNTIGMTYHGTLAALYFLGSTVIKRVRESEILESGEVAKLVSFLDQVKRELDDWKNPTRSISPALLDLDFSLDEWEGFEKALSLVPCKRPTGIPEVSEGNPDKLVSILNR